MKNLLYSEFIRNRKPCVRMLRYIVIVPAIGYILAAIVDAVAPECNLHMQFSDTVRHFLSLYEWQEELYSNLWCIFAVGYPFFFLYQRMAGFSRSLLREGDGMEKAGVTGGQVLFSKLAVWAVRSLTECLVLFVENAMFFIFLKNKEMAAIAGWYYIRLFAVSLIYLALALFAASCSAEVEHCEELCLVALLLPFVLARMYAWVQLFADRMMASGGRLPDADRIYTAIQRLSSLQIFAPVTWCYAGMHFPVAYGLCGIAITVVLGVTGYSIYTGASQDL